MTGIKASFLIPRGGAISGGVTIEGQVMKRYSKREIRRDLKKSLKEIEKDMMKEVRKRKK